MTALAYTNAEVLIDGYDFTAQFNELAVEHSAEMIDASNFGVATRVNKGGLFVSSITGAGFAVFGTGLVGSVLFDAVAGADVLVSVFPAGVTEGEASGYSMLGQVETFTLAGAVGTLTPFTLAVRHGNA